jgi:hypothetical protein
MPQPTSRKPAPKKSGSSLPAKAQPAKTQQLKVQQLQVQPAPVFVSCALWAISSELIVTLDERFGEPVDTYVNGSQVWLRSDGPNDVTLEYRLHPIGGYIKPKGVQTDQVLAVIALALAQGEEPIAGFDTLWEGLEVFVAFDDEGPLAAAELARIGEEQLGITATAFGEVDHESVAVRWQQSERQTSIVSELMSQLRGT